MRRVPIRKMLSDSATRRSIIARSMRFIQAVEGRDISERQALEAYDRAVGKGRR